MRPHNESAYGYRINTEIIFGCCSMGTCTQQLCCYIDIFHTHRYAAMPHISILRMTSLADKPEVVPLYLRTARADQACQCPDRFTRGQLIDTSHKGQRWYGPTCPDCGLTRIDSRVPEPYHYCPQRLREKPDPDRAGQWGPRPGSLNVPSSPQP